MQPTLPIEMERSGPEEEKSKQPKRVSFAQFDPMAQQQLNSVSIQYFSNVSKLNFFIYKVYDWLSGHLDLNEDRLFE